MSEILMHHYQDKHSAYEDTSLTEQLLEVFKRKFHGSKHFHVLGILSYSSDDDPEKFVKIDFSSSLTSNCLDDECSTHKDHFRHPGAPINVSPPVLPPTVIRNSLQVTNDDYSDVTDRQFKVCDEFCDAYGDNNRRDRRKCRRPKRQLVESESLCSKEPSTLQDVTNKTGYVENVTAAKLLRLDSSPRNPCSVMEIASDNPELETISSFGRPHLRQLHHDNIPNPTSVALCSVADMIKPLSGENAINEAVYSVGCVDNTKFKVTPKSIGLNDLGELCGILPISALLNRVTNSNVEVGSASIKSTAPNSLICTTTVPKESNAQTNFNYLSASGIPTTTGSSQSILVNPTLAAALAAAFSGSPVVANFNNESIPNTSSTGFSSPTITFTAASGEVIGAIPVSSANSSYAVVSSALPTVPSVLPTTGTSLPVSNYATVANLASVISSLRSANTLSEVPVQAVHSIPASTTSCPSVVSNNQIAFLQSISANTQKPLISVGPTLALIGTLGLNSSSVASTVSQENAIPNVGFNTIGSALLATHLSQTSATNVANNNAALVAAALLRGLVSAKQTTQETVEHYQVDTTAANSTSPLTIITNGSSNAQQVRPTFIAENSVSSLNAILTPRATHLAGPVASISDIPIPSSLSSSIGSFTTSALQNSARNSIMLSYPRTSGEMNILLTPASVTSNTLNPTLSSLSTVPASFSFQTLSNSMPPGITLASPLVLHPHTNFPSLTNTNSTISTTCTISVSTPVTSARQQVCIGGGKQIDAASCHATIKPTPNDVKSSTRTVDPTTSAIDRILQTIKGCMNSAENRENEAKSKISKKVENSSTSIINGGTHRIQLDATSSSSNKFQPMTICLSKRSAGVINGDNCNISNRISLSSTERLPLPPLNKGLSDTESQAASITKVYRCRYCGKTFNRKFCRERHERLHTGVKPYTCEICDEKFIRLEDKKRHVRSLQHILVGRGSLLRNESSSFSSGDLCMNNTEPSCILPLLAHTLRTDENEATDKAFVEIDDPTEPGISEPSSIEHGSECESSDAEDDPEKEVTELNTIEITYPNAFENKASPMSNPNETPLTLEESCSPPNLSSTDKVVLPSGLEIDDGSQPPISPHRLRIRCRHALKETQAESNNASIHHFDALTRSVTLDTKSDIVS